MTRRDLLAFVMLGAIWGASFLFMRVSVPEFGAVALIECRVVIGAVFLTIALALRGGLPTLRGLGAALTLVGAINTAIPFSLFAFATISLTAGFSSVLNATVPLFSAALAMLWFRERLTPAQLGGLGVGFLGVVILVWSKLGVPGDLRAVAAGLSASVLYAMAAHYSKRRFAGVAPLSIAAGSLIAASVMLLPLAIWWWPERMPSWKAWGCALVLGVVCTGLAYILYFRLLARVGAAKAVIVTYLIPVFGTSWGALLLRESLSLRMLIGCGLILCGIAFVTRPQSVAKSS
jgi:drug/metabolite transporter (DMT)-like permease